MKLSLLFLMLIAASINIAAQTEPLDTDDDGYRNVSTLDHLIWIDENILSWSLD